MGFNKFIPISDFTNMNYEDFLSALRGDKYIDGELSIEPYFGFSEELDSSSNARYCVRLYSKVKTDTLKTLLKSDKYRLKECIFWEIQFPEELYRYTCQYTGKHLSEILEPYK